MTNNNKNNNVTTDETVVAYITQIIQNAGNLVYSNTGNVIYVDAIEVRFNGVSNSIVLISDGKIYTVAFEGHEVIVEELNFSSSNDDKFTCVEVTYM